MECNFYNVIRIKYIPMYQRVIPSMAKFVELLKIESKPLLYKMYVCISNMLLKNDKII